MVVQLCWLFKVPDARDAMKRLPFGRALLMWKYGWECEEIRAEIEAMELVKLVGSVLSGKPLQPKVVQLIETPYQAPDREGFKRAQQEGKLQGRIVRG